MKILKKILHRKPSAVFMAGLLAFVVTDVSVYQLIDFSRPYAYVFYFGQHLVMYLALIGGEYTDIYNRERQAGVLNKREFKQELFCIIALAILLEILGCSITAASKFYFWNNIS